MIAIIQGNSIKTIAPLKASTNYDDNKYETQEPLVPTTSRIQARQQYASRFPTSRCYCWLSWNAGDTSKTCLVVLMEVFIDLFQPRESDAITIIGQNSNTFCSGSPYYQGTTGRSNYHPYRLVPRQSNNKPPTFSFLQRARTKTSTQINYVKGFGGRYNTSLVHTIMAPTRPE